MTLLARLRSMAAGLFGRRRVEQSMAEELRFHIEAYRDDLIRSGVPRSEAERRARIEFGSVARVREECRQARGLAWFDDLRGDLRFAARMLRRSPGFASIAILSLALGIGANTAIFSFVNTVLLQNLPVQQPERLFFVDDSGGRSGGSNGPPYPCYEILRDYNHYFSAMAAFSGSRFKVTIDGSSEQVTGQSASGSYFQLLGVPAILGRTLAPADDSEIGRGGPDGPVAVISFSYWQRRFGGDRSVLGKVVEVGTHRVTIVGVTPPEFFGLQVGTPIDITIPMALSGNNLRTKSLWWFSVAGRLKDGATPERAQTELDSMFQAYMDDIGEHGEMRTNYFDHIVLVPASKGLNELRHDFSKPLLTVMAIVGLVLLIGCANLANLLLARATARRNEISVRLAIGAGRGRLIRQMLTEGLLLVTLGAAAGLLLAQWGVKLLAGFFAGSRNHILLAPQFDWHVLGFTLAVSVLTGFLFSIAPALHAARADGGRSVTSRSQVRLGRALVVVQVTLSLILLCGAALFVRSLYNLQTLNAGFSRSGVLTMQVDATLPPSPSHVEPREAVAEHARIARIWNGLLERVAALPGVKSASASTLSPLNGRDRGVLIAIAGESQLPEHDAGIHLNHVSLGYFDTLGIGLLAGRAFTPHDRAYAPRVAILNETAARFYFGGTNPLGRKISFPGQRVPGEYEVVGICRDARYQSLRKEPARLAYLPLEQAVDPIRGISLAIRTANSGAPAMAAVRKEVRDTVPGGFVSNVATIGQQVSASLAQERLVSTLAGFFGALALALTCIGLYGILSYAVLQRTREIGIRIALGAQRRSVIWLILHETVLLIAAGLALGIPAQRVAASYVASQLFGLKPSDPATISAAALILVVVAIVAGYLPARRASRVDPTEALRYE